MGYEVLWEYSNHVEAEIAKGILEANRIKVILHSDDCGGMAGGQTFVRGVKLLVPAENIERAKLLLNE